MSQVISKIANRTSVKFYALVLAAALALTPVAALAIRPDEDLDHDTMKDNGEDNCIPRSETASDRLAAKNRPYPGTRIQPDFDGDGFGTRCDADYDNNGIVGYSDFAFFSQVIGTVDTVRRPAETPTSEIDWNDEFTVGGILVTPELMDHTGDGRVNLADLDVLLDGFGYPPGPSSVANVQ